MCCYALPCLSRTRAFVSLQIRAFASTVRVQGTATFLRDCFPPHALFRQVFALFLAYLYLLCLISRTSTFPMIFFNPLLLGYILGRRHSFLFVLGNSKRQWRLLFSVQHILKLLPRIGAIHRKEKAFSRPLSHERHVIKHGSYTHIYPNMNTVTEQSLRTLRMYW